MNSYAALANLLDYPEADLLDRAGHALACQAGAIEERLQVFRSQVELIGVGALQELYIETFDLKAETSPYLGHHMFGEEIRRNLFIAQLRGRYRELGIPDTTELPDHLANVLRFLAVLEAGQERTELVRDCLVPALGHMLRAMRADNPYTSLLQAILLVSQQDNNRSVPEDGETAWTPFSSSFSPTSR